MFKAYLTHCRAALAVLTLCIALYSAAGVLYGLPAEPLAYSAALAMFIAGVGFGAGFAHYRRRCSAVEQCLNAVSQPEFSLPTPETRLEAAYQQLLRAVCQSRTEVAGETERRRTELLDYYTLWLHQVKTPIAALHLLLQGPDAAPVAAEADIELLKIEQYVNMVLSYLRLDSDRPDLVPARQPIDPIVRGAVRKYARMFIRRHIALHYTAIGFSAVTDEKWLAFVVEQILSNALKYTPEGGSITVCAEGDALLIADTGIGICPEDLPRVCEKGFTGYNGRADKKATGLGLYLCSRVCKKLGHTLTLESAPGEGTAVHIGFFTETPVYE